MSGTGTNVSETIFEDPEAFEFFFTGLNSFLQSKWFSVICRDSTSIRLITLHHSFGSICTVQVPNTEVSEVGFE